MFQSFFHWQSKLSTTHLVIITIAALVFNLWATDVLNASYAASGFPVPYWQAQLSFDHEKLKGWYDHLIGKGTLEKYVQTQNLDFIFIASVLVLHTAALLAISRLVPVRSRARLFIVWASLLAIAAPLADGIENVISYIMLANPTDFAPSLALVYSSFAAVKFGMFTFAYVAAICGLLAATVMWGHQHWSHRKSRLLNS